MKEIIYFNTHIEVTEYECGNYQSIQKLTSYYDTVTHQFVPIAYLFYNEIMYLPRGLGHNVLQKAFPDHMSIWIKEKDKHEKILVGTMKNEPRDHLQEKAIDFLDSKGKYKKGLYFSQFGLNLDTGSGKTFCMVNSIVNQRMKAIIIVHQDKIKKQWYETLVNMTSIPEDDIIDIHGSAVMESILNGTNSASVYLVNHQTLSSFARLYGYDKLREFFKELKVGIKVYDEAHKFFTNTLIIDFFSNTYRTYYLTATFDRSNPKEQPIYKRAFAEMYRFEEDKEIDEAKLKHQKFVIVSFRSRPQAGDIYKIQTNYGFSSYNYIDYELNEENNTLLRTLVKIIKMNTKIGGKSLIISPKIESCEVIKRYVEDYVDKEVSVLHSKKTSNENISALTSDIISTTFKSSGTGVDIKGLQCIYNLEPLGSKTNADQLRGRLRPYKDNEDTYIFHFVDLSVPQTQEFLMRILPTMKRKCKEIINLTIND